MIVIHRKSLRKGTRARVGLALCAVAGFGLLAGCEEGTNIFAPKVEPAVETTQSTKIIERDVEAPEVFSATEAGLWDGRPSLGGVWVAHPDATDPERVIIRNNANNKFVIGALFRREREIPGPRIQVSSDAASAIGILAGQPVELNVTALRREEVPQEIPVATKVDETGSAEAPEVEASALAPVAAAEAALAKVEGETPTAPAAAETAPAPKPATPASASKLPKPYVQIGIFSVEANAKNTAAQMRNAGMIPIIKEGESKGKTFWRVVVGPASSKSELNQLVKKIKDVGFTDAYAVTH